MIQGTVTPISERRTEDIQYMDLLTQELARIAVPKKPRPKPEDVKQAASTQRALDLQATRDPADDKAWVDRPLTLEAQIKCEPVFRTDGTLDIDETLKKITGERDLPIDQVNIIEAHRRNSKNTLGQSLKPSVSEENKVKAVDALLFSGMADLSSPGHGIAVGFIKAYESASIEPVTPDKEKSTFAGGLLHTLWKKGWPVYWFTNRKLTLELAEKYTEKKSD